MKRILRTVSFAALSVVLSASLLCGCGSKAAYSTNSAKTNGAFASYDMAMPESAGYAYASSDYGWEDSDSEMDYAPSEGYGKADSMLSGEQNNRAEAFDKIIYSGNARVESIEFDATIDRVYELVDSVGGFLESSYITGKDYRSEFYGSSSYRNASFTIRVPREAFRSFAGSLETLGNLTYSSYDAQNISTSYYDTQSRLETYRTEEERLLAMLEKAENVEDMLNIEDRLASVRYNIESLTTTLTNWDSKINYSTLYLEIQEVKELTRETPITRTFGEDLVQSVKDSVEWLIEALKNTTIFIVSAIPVLVIPAAIVVVIVLLLRSRKHKKMAKKQEKIAENDVNVDR